MSAIGQVLVDADVLSEEALSRALEAGGDLAWTLIEQNLVEEHEYAAVIARHFGVPEAELDNVSPDPAIVSLIPEALAKRTHSVPLTKEGAQLTVATTNPGDESARRQLARAAGVSIKMEAAGPKRLAAAIATPAVQAAWQQYMVALRDADAGGGYARDWSLLGFPSLPGNC